MAKKNDKGPKWLPVTTPIGTMGWCNLAEPDRYKPKHGPEVVKWKAKYILTDSKDDQAMLKKLLDYENECRKFEGLEPVKAPSCIKEYNDEEFIEAYMKVDRGVPNIVDSANKPTDYRPSKGDKCRMRFKAAFMSVQGAAYLVLYLEGVQVVEANNNRGGSGGFDPVDSGWVDDMPAREPTEQASEPDTVAVASDLDDLPF